MENKQKYSGDMGWNTVVEISRDGLRAIKTLGVMAKGAFWFIIIAYLVWLVNNFDVQVKTMRYPEAVRELKITVTAEQFSK